MLMLRLNKGPHYETDKPLSSQRLYSTACGTAVCRVDGTMSLVDVSQVVVHNGQEYV